MPRLDHLLARNLGLTRGDARDIIKGGLLFAADGTPLPEPRTEIRPDQLPYVVRIEDGEEDVNEAHELHDAMHVLLHKPAGYVTALRDEQHQTAYDLLAEAPLHDELRPVGRLDLETTGLLLFTTDGQLVQRLTHPKRGFARRYQAALARPFSPVPADLVLEDGHRPTITALSTIDPEAAHPALIRPPEAPLLAEIAVVGGAYHEVRRIFAALGSHVLGLCRVGFGRLELPRDLEPGRYVPFSPADV